MSSLAVRREAWIPGRMTGPFDTHDDERRRAAEALKILRKRAGKSQEEAAEAAEIHTQSWRNYENGKRPMTTPLLATLTKAIASSPEEHALEMVRLKAPEPGWSFGAGMEERGRIMRLPVGGFAHAGALRRASDQGGEVIDLAARFVSPFAHALPVADSAMVPYAKPGGLVTYDTSRPPRAGDGCVISLRDDRLLIRQFERIVDDRLYVSVLYPTTQEESYLLAEVDGLYAITLRCD